MYRVDLKTKSSKGTGSRGSCAECHKLTNIFCIVCKRWLCDPQLAANRSQENTDDPKFIKITFHDGEDRDADVDAICGVFSCWHKAHQAALEADGALERGWHCSEIEDNVSSMGSP